MATLTPSARVAEAALDQPFVLDSIVHSASPTTTDETDWHRYVINQGGNQIVGYRRGSPDSVRQEVAFIIEQLNARRTVKAGRKHITIASNKKS